MEEFDDGLSWEVISFVHCTRIGKWKNGSAIYKSNGEISFLEIPWSLRNWIIFFKGKNIIPYFSFLFYFIIAPRKTCFIKGFRLLSLKRYGDGHDLYIMNRNGRGVFGQPGIAGRGMSCHWKPRLTGPRHDQKAEEGNILQCDDNKHIWEKKEKNATVMMLLNHYTGVTVTAIIMLLLW